ncbi:MAG TPA: hypothetical protein VFS60_00365 [Thermoanaerobaculia bacterium]|nr:hypothetical protein [Thermoanaerobaculia bacterium]
MSASAPVFQPGDGSFVGGEPRGPLRGDEPPQYGPNRPGIGEQPYGTEFVPRVVTVSTPNAGAEFSQRVTGGSIWLLHSVRATLVTAAAVANRLPALTFSDGSTTWATLPTSIAVTATSTTTVSWLADPGGVGTLAGGLVGPLPGWPCALPPGTLIASLTAAIQAADQYSQVALYCYEVTAEPVGTDWLHTERGMDLLKRLRF